MAVQRVGIVDCGEVDRIFAACLKNAGVEWVGVWDLKLDDPRQRSEAVAVAAKQGVQVCASTTELCAQSTLVIAAVTASSTLAVAFEVAVDIQPEAFFLDLNSASPGTKQEAAEHVDTAGGRFFNRAAQHGQRRADKHDWMAGKIRVGASADVPDKPDWQAYADRLQTPGKTRS